MIIRFNHVYKSYKNTNFALNNIHLEINKGDFVFLLGKSGAGKTTFLKHLYMENVPDRGEVVISLSKNVVYNSNKIKFKQIQLLRQKIGIIFQDFKLFNDRNVFENIAFPLKLQWGDQTKIKNRVYEVLSEYGLSHKANQFPYELSGGEQQRIAIARAIVNYPYLIIADEPTGNLDMANSIEVLNIFKKTHAKGTTIVMATHERQLIKSLPYHVVEIDKGKVLHQNF